MSALILLEILLKATLLLALAAIVDHAVLRGRASAAARHLVWTLAVVGLLLLPVLGWMLPAWSPPLEARAPAAIQAAPPQTGPAVEIAIAPPRAAEPMPREAPDVAAEPSAVLIPLLVALYGAGVLLLLLKVAAEQWIVRRLARASSPVRDADWSALLDSVRLALGTRRMVTLLRGDAPTIPLTWGIFSPAVLLPADADEWTEPRRRVVLLHEVAHVVRHDCLTQTLAAVACALYWPHPGAWWAAARLRVERELACDDQALAHGMRPRDYAGHLLELARGAEAPRALSTLAVPMATASHLEARLLAAIDGGRNRTAPGRRARVFAATGAALFLLPVAAVRAGAADEAPEPVAPAVAVAPRAPIVGQEQGGTWHLRAANARESRLDVPAVHVLMITRGMNTFYVPLSRMDGLTADRIASGDSARFRLRRDAGTFDFRGAFRGGRGTGQFVFTADPAFAAGLARRGIGRPSAEDIYSMARHDVSFELLDELAKQGYATPTAAALVRLGTSGADLRFIRGMAALGYRFRTVGEAISFSNSGVSPAFIRQMVELGYRSIPAASLVQLRNHSLTPDSVRRMNAHAGRRLTVPELVSSRMRGAAEPVPTTPVAVAPLATSFVAATPVTIAPLSTSSTPLAGRWTVRGTRGAFTDLRLDWDDGTNWDRWVRTSALSGTSAGEIASSAPAAFRIEQDAGSFDFGGAFQGGRGGGQFRFRPNRAFVATLRTLVDGAGDVSDHQLKNLAWGGVSASDIREFRAAGLRALTLREVVDMAVFQVTPEYVRELRALELEGSTTPAAIIDVRHGGVPAAYIRELASLGYRGISAGVLVELWREKVTPDFIRAVRASGAGATTPESLIALRRRAREQLRER